RAPPADDHVARLRQQQARVGVADQRRRRRRQGGLEQPLVRAARLLRAHVHGARIPRRLDARLRAGDAGRRVAELPRAPQRHDPRQTITYGGAPNSLGPGSGTGDPNGPATDPIIGDIVAPTGDCRTSDQPATGGYTGTSQPLTNHTTYVGLGEVDVHYALG